MAQAEDLDFQIDGYDPDSLHTHASTPSTEPRPERHKRRTQKHTESHTQPAPDPEKKTRQQKPNAVIDFFASDGFRLFFGGFLLILAILVVVGFVSYLHSGATDQSAALNHNPSEIVTNSGKVKNFGGPLGLWLAQTLMSRGFGVGALVLVIYFVALALGMWRIKKVSFWSATFKCLLVMTSISMVVGLITYNATSFFFYGGEHGHYINEWLIKYTTPLGAILVSVLLTLAVVSVYLSDIKTAYAKYAEIRERRRLQQELEEERRRELEDVETAENESDTDETTESSDNAADSVPAQIQPNRPITIILDPSADRQNDNLQTDTEPDEDKEEEFTVTTSEIEQAEDFTPADPGKSETYDHRAELSRYQMPVVELLEDRPVSVSIDMDEQQENKDRIVKTLLEYKIPIQKIEATVGPTVTLYEIVPAEGVRIAQIKRLEDDIALSLAAMGIRIIAPIPGKGTVGIEVPNRDPQTVSMRSVIASKKFKECNMALPMAMGATVSNDIFIADLTKMPHLLVAGATGMGKSVGLNAIIASLLYKKHPSELKFVLIDPKMVEFSLYSKLERHYLAKLPGEEDAIITDMAKVIETLNSLCIEMDNRYSLLRKAGVRSLEEYNKKFSQRRLNPENGHRYLPYIVVIVDEFADLIMTAGKEVETPIARIAQKARAVGIHMIIATQRPSTNVITGIIKANFPGRIAFRVSQMVDSKTILDRTGANRLIGRGDMLFSHNGSLDRVQCAFISTEEVETLTEYIDNQVGYDQAYPLPEYVPEAAEGGSIAGASMERDALFDEAARFVVSRQQGSTSSLQRQFGIGYNRAGKLMDQMEAAGIVGPVCGSKPRNILVDIITLDQILGN